MIVFEQQGETVLPNFQQGNFNLVINGRLDVKMRGQTTTLEGSNSELTIRLDEQQRPLLRVHAGRVKVVG